MPPILVQYLTATEKPCYWCWAVLGVDVNMHAGQCRHLATVKARVEHFRNFCERVRALGPAGQNGGQQGYSVPVAWRNPSLSSSYGGENAVHNQRLAAFSHRLQGPGERQPQAPNFFAHELQSAEPPLRDWVPCQATVEIGLRQPRGFAYSPPRGGPQNKPPPRQGTQSRQQGLRNPQAGGRGRNQGRPPNR